MHVSKVTPGIMWLFASLNIHYNKNTKVQKQNETKVKKLQTKVVDSLQYIFSIDKLRQNLVV